MRTLFALIASVGLLGCVGGIDVPPPTDTEDPPEDGVGGGGTGPAASEAKALFETNVHPVIVAKCAGCHTAGSPVGNITGFVSMDISDAYVTAVGYQAVVGDWTANAPILTKITGNAKTPAHQSITYDTAEIQKITDWLGKELEARGAGNGGGGTPTPEGAGQVTQRLLEEWSGCMTLENFQAADMRAWGDVGSTDGDCDTCHVMGEQGFVASRVSNPYFFGYITTDKYYMLQYFTVDLSQGIENAKIIVNERTFQGVGTGLAPHQQHPRFNPTNNNGYAALQRFYTDTMNAKMAAPNGICGPSKLIN